MEGAAAKGGTFLSSYARTLSNGALRFHTDRCDGPALRAAGGEGRREHARKLARRAQANAMLMALAAEPSFEMRFAPGDIQLVNNHVIYHGRTPFEDDAATGQDRLRLWLAMPNSRALPAGHEVLWRTTEAGAVRGGIGQARNH